MKNAIDNYMDVSPSDTDIVILTPVRKLVKNSSKIEEQDFIDDFNFARGTLHDLLEQGAEALQGALNVAKASQNPRAYEVASTLLGQVTGTAKDLLSLTETASKITNTKVSDSSDKKDDSVYIGSTEDLRKLLAGE